MAIILEHTVKTDLMALVYDRYRYKKLAQGHHFSAHCKDQPQEIQFTIINICRREKEL